jgi:hypothetical protein
MMLQKIRKLLCIHSFEYEIGHNIVVKECRKCGFMKALDLKKLVNTRSSLVTMNRSIILWKKPSLVKPFF